MSRKIGTSKSDCWYKILKKSCLFTFSNGNRVPITRSMTASGYCLASLSMLIHFQNYSGMALLFFLCMIDFFTKIYAADKIKYYRLSKNTKRQQKKGLLALRKKALKKKTVETFLNDKKIQL